LRAKGDAGGAITAYRAALRLNENDPETHRNLGAALSDKGQLDKAIAEYRAAILLNKDYFVAHHNLGAALRSQGHLDEAIVEYRAAVRLKKDFPEARYNLGSALRAKNLLDEAIVEYRAAIHFKKDFPEAHLGLGLALASKGQFRQAVEELRCGDELGSRNPRWPDHASVQAQLREVEQMARLDERLATVLGGKGQPQDAAERLAFAHLCQQPYRKQNATAARFFTEAFADRPALADDLAAANRYNAACSAALAGCGQGQEADRLSDQERASLRTQARDWLRADLRAWQDLLEKGPAQKRPAIVQQLAHWLEDPDFNGVRGAAALAKLPEVEREPWRALWADVATTLAREKGRPQEKPSPAEVPKQG
jgi:Flp pilus assembly protein TadD